ncbi:hypothetical protein PPYR_02320 [Photinus pyralis]|uniref:Uncharacterized protein n=1 Tax=Photinus pyralis TaxID=7054 RepID=A0A5N4B7L9_PHOPY|nr:hypothetical protein PPYR_02320 [Photinus pyralis]
MKYAVGHPTVYNLDDCGTRDLRIPLVKYSILPPSDLYHSVLPFKMHDKSMFVSYMVLVFEVWEYEISQYDKASMGGGLFSGYVDNFLKIKQECSGWRSWCVDDGSKEHLCEYLDIWSKIYSKIIFKFMLVSNLNY